MLKATITGQAWLKVFLRGNNTISNLARDLFCDSFAIPAFCLCPKNLSATKCKRNRLISLVEEISRQTVLTLSRGY